MKTATIQDLISWNPCYSTMVIRRLAGGIESFTALDVLRREDIPAEDRLWVVLRPELIEERTLHLFACDCAEHVHWLQAGWVQRGGSADPGVQVCVEVDMSYRPLGFRGPHLGVQRSPVRSAGEFRELLHRVKQAPELKLKGVMGYEAQIAGVGEQNPFSRLLDPVKQMLKSRSVPDVARKRSEMARCLEEEGFRRAFFNGGGTGSIRSTTVEPWITEVTAGSGFLQSHLFDYYADNTNEPAFCFALQVTRKPEPVNARRVAFVTTSAKDRATVAAWAGRNYWKG